MGSINSSSKPRVLFDIGGVLIRWRDEWAFETMAKHIGVSYKRLEWEALLLRGELQSGRLSPREFHRALSARLGTWVPASFPRIWVGELTRRAHINQSAIDVAQHLRARGFRTGLFSNTDPSHVRVFLEQNWFPAFDPWLLSFQLKAIKPDPVAFHRAETAMGLAPRDLLLIDDRIANVQAARRRGWGAVHYVNARKLARDLKEWLR